MNYLSVENVSRSFGDRTILSDITFYIDQGQKVAFVARNGTGKTSLLKIIAGLDTPDTGTVQVNKKITMAYLDQEPPLDPGQKVFDAVYTSQNPIVRAIRSYEVSLAAGDSAAIQSAFEKIEALQAWDYEVKIKQILYRLDIPQLDARIGHLSGGQQKRVALANVLINDPDFLVLDEPTNHLDLGMIEWLEDYMDKSKLTLLMVTHDRYFLDKVCNQVLELDDGKIYKHHGNYTYFLEQTANRKENLQARIGKAKSLHRKELEWMRRQPKARGTKAKARIEAFHELEEQASRKVNTEKLTLDIKMNRLGGKILECYNLRKSYDELVILDKFSYKFKRRDRVGVIGKNGSGKTTFLRLLVGSESLDGGKIVVGETVQFGFYTQTGLQPKSDKRVIDMVRDVAEAIPMYGGKKLTAAQLLERFLFPREMHYQPVGQLSGGEKRRLHLLTIFMANPNFLILDEPTNDLDILTLNVLEDFLEQFEGCLLIVTHDRYFMDKLVDHIFVFEGDGKIMDFPGNYTDYRNWQKQTEKTKPGVLEKSPEPSSAGEAYAKQGKMGFKEKREFKQLEKDIAVLEQTKTDLEEQLNSGNLDHQSLHEITAKLSKVMAEIDERSDRWLELSELK